MENKNIVLKYADNWIFIFCNCLKIFHKVKQL